MTCDYVGVDFRYVDDVNEENFIEEIKGKNVDVIISFQQQIFKEELLNAPNRVCLNVHTGKLPGYRGVKPVFWMMKNDEDTFGVTIHTMEKEIDTGSVVVRRPWRRVAGSSVLQNQFWSYECSSFAIIDALEKISSGQEYTLDRVDSTSAYYRTPSAEDRDQAVRSGIKMV